MQQNGTRTAELPEWPDGADKTAPEAARRTAAELGIRELKVVWGEETHNPIQYHTVKIGGLEATLVLGQDDDVEEAADRAFKVLGEIAARQFEEKLDGFFGRAKQAAARAKTYRG